MALAAQHSAHLLHLRSALTQDVSLCIIADFARAALCFPGVAAVQILASRRQRRSDRFIDGPEGCCMLKATMLQLAFVLVVAGIGLLAGGLMAGVSVMLGGVCYLLPSLFFAMRLNRLTRRVMASGVSYPLEFLLGEAIKILSTIGLLALCHYLVPGLVWGWFLGGLAAALQAGFFAFLFKH